MDPFDKVPRGRYALYVVAMTLGMFARGLTGAGNAIVVISIWAVVGTIGGVELAGPLGPVIAIECISSLSCNIMLFFKIKAWRNVNRAFMLTVTPANMAASPLGVYVLRIYPQSTVELVIGSLLLFVSVKNYKTPVYMALKRWCKLPRYFEASSQQSYEKINESDQVPETEMLDPGLSSTQVEKFEDTAHVQDSRDYLEDVTTSHGVVFPSEGTIGLSEDGQTLQAAVEGKPLLNLLGSSGKEGEGPICLHSTPNYPNCNGVVSCAQASLDQHPGPEGELELTRSICNEADDIQFDVDFITEDSQLEGSGQDFKCNQATAKFLLAGALAGAGCGFLGSMVGIGGPPLFLLYQYLHTPKEEARATGIILGAITPRPILYLLSGFFSTLGLPLHAYIVCASMGVLGSVGGDWLSKHVDQATFLRVINLLVVLASCLMLASGTGVIST